MSRKSPRGHLTEAFAPPRVYSREDLLSARHERLALADEVAGMKDDCLAALESVGELKSPPSSWAGETWRWHFERYRARPEYDKAAAAHLLLSKIEYLDIGRRIDSADRAALELAHDLMQLMVLDQHRGWLVVENTYDSGHRRSGDLREARDRHNAERARSADGRKATFQAAADAYWHRHPAASRSQVARDLAATFGTTPDYFRQKIQKPEAAR